MNLHDFILLAAPMIRLPESITVNPPALLLALADVESSGGARSEAARFEPHLVPAIRRAHPEAYARYGHRLAASYGPFQMLGVTALELGMEGPPERLAQPEVALVWALAFLHSRLQRPSHRFIGGLPSPAQPQAIADAWNSGSAADDSRPLDYIERLSAAYARRFAELGGGAA